MSLVNYTRERFPRYVGADEHYTAKFFNRDNIDKISYNVTLKLKGVHPENKNIIVPNETILSVMDSIFEDNPRTGIEVLCKMTTAMIVNYIKDEYEIDQQNSKLNIDVIKYDGSYGIRSYPQIKLREKRPTPFIFIENY